MSRWIESLRAFLSARSPQERRSIAVAGALIVAILIVLGGIRPLLNAVERSGAEAERSRRELLQAVQLLKDVEALREPLKAVESRIVPDESANLFTLLETIAREASIEKELDSIKPTKTLKSTSYPETRVELVLKGASLEQTVRLLYGIESARIHLIIRSLTIKARDGKSGGLDVNVSVSSFGRT
ncbi:MAG: type II secretion system protein GspM [Myxococcota bacterium]